MSEGFFQIHKDGKDISDQTTYPSLEQARRALPESTAGLDIAELDAHDKVIRRYPANEMPALHPAKEAATAKRERRKWNRVDWGLIIAFLTLLATVMVVPEVRRLLRLDKNPVSSTPAISPKETATNQSNDTVATPPLAPTAPIAHKHNKLKPKPPVIQQPTQNGPVAIAPNGIANAAPNLGTQTVNNFAPSPRTIPPTVGASCVSLISTVHGTVSVNALMGDTEGFDFAKEWYALFAASGWSMKDNQVRTLLAVGEPTRGLEVRFHGDRPSPGQQIIIPPFLVPLGKCVEELKMQIVANAFPDMPENEIFFVVGPRPN